MTACRRGCCWTPYTCGKRHACACHVEWHDTRTARQRLEDYLDTLGGDE